MDNNKFELGQLVMTMGISDKIEENSKFGKEVLESLERYKQADFSDIEFKEDIKANNKAIKDGYGRIFASYKTSQGDIWIVTEWDRSITTILFPSEY